MTYPNTIEGTPREPAYLGDMKIVKSEEKLPAGVAVKIVGSPRLDAIRFSVESDGFYICRNIQNKRPTSRTCTNIASKKFLEGMSAKGRNRIVIDPGKGNDYIFFHRGFVSSAVKNSDLIWFTSFQFLLKLEKWNDLDLVSRPKRYVCEGNGTDYRVNDLCKRTDSKDCVKPKCPEGQTPKIFPADIVEYVR